MGSKLFLGQKENAKLVCQKRVDMYRECGLPEKDKPPEFDVLVKVDDLDVGSRTPSRSHHQPNSFPFPYPFESSAKIYRLHLAIAGSKDRGSEISNKCFVTNAFCPKKGVRLRLTRRDRDCFVFWLRVLLYSRGFAHPC